MSEDDGAAGSQLGLAADDNLVIPFLAERAKTNGRIIRLGSVIDEILRRHDYPEPVSRLLGDAVLLAGLLGSALKFDGKFILQTKTDGPVNLIVADYETPGRLRGYASFDAEKLADLDPKDDQQVNNLLGHGHLALTIDRGPDTERYQGIVPLEGGGLQEAAHTYFRQSEQLPTLIRLSVGKLYVGGEANSQQGWSWRAGGLMIQNLTHIGGKTSHEETETGEAINIAGADSEDWTRARLLAETVETHELLDPSLTSERLLFRLFHEERVRAYKALSFENYCHCSRERIEELLSRFSAQELQDMVVDGDIVVTCQFCNTGYRFDAAAHVDGKRADK